MILGKRFVTSNYENERPLPTGKNKKVIGLMKDELGRKFIGLGPKTYSYLRNKEVYSKTKT